MLDALAFLSVSDIAAGMPFLRENFPPNVAGLTELMDYFEATYASSRSSQQLVLRIRRFTTTVPAVSLECT